MSFKTKMFIIRNLNVKNYGQVKNFCSKIPAALRSKKGKSVKTEVKHFVDVKRVRAIGGNGGDGQISFLQLWSNENAGPDGGDGGNGGHVLLQATSNVRGLNHVDSVIKGDHGEKGYNKDCHGKNAPHTIIKVPLGTIIKDSDGNVIGDLNQEDSLFILSRGGAGGHGNHFFTTDTEQSPIIAEYGALGEDLSYTLEIKSMANFGLLGMPNAGKSTLLQAISRARPKVASYPFTTLKPHLGMVLYEDYQQVAVADLPGLIEDSHKDRGLGIEFLRHVERCTALLYVIDVTANPVDTLNILKNELTLFNKNLLVLPQLVIANKMDLPSSDECLKELKKDLPNEEIIPISAKFGTNLSQLLKRIRELYDAMDKPAARD